MEIKLNDICKHLNQYLVLKSVPAPKEPQLLLLLMFLCSTNICYRLLGVSTVSGSGKTLARKNVRFLLLNIYIQVKRDS